MGGLDYLFQLVSSIEEIWCGGLAPI